MVDLEADVHQSPWVHDLSVLLQSSLTSENTSSVVMLGALPVESRLQLYISTLLQLTSGQPPHHQPICQRLHVIPLIFCSITQNKVATATSKSVVIGLLDGVYGLRAIL